jgi:hypothetical protein
MLLNNRVNHPDQNINRSIWTTCPQLLLSWFIFILQAIRLLLTFGSQGVSQPSETIIQELNRKLQTSLKQMLNLSHQKAMSFVAALISLILSHNIVKSTGSPQTKLDQSWLDIQATLISLVLVSIHRAYIPIQQIYIVHRTFWN